MQGAIGLSANAAEPILAFDHFTVARAEVALDPARFAGGLPVAGRMSWCFEMHDRKLGKRLKFQCRAGDGLNEGFRELSCRKEREEVVNEEFSHEIIDHDIITESLARLIGEIVDVYLLWCDEEQFGRVGLTSLASSSVAFEGSLLAVYQDY